MTCQEILNLNEVIEGSTFILDIDINKNKKLSPHLPDRHFVEITNVVLKGDNIDNMDIDSYKIGEIKTFKKIENYRLTDNIYYQLFNIEVANRSLLITNLKPILDFKGSGGVLDIVLTSIEYQKNLYK